MINLSHAECGGATDGEWRFCVYTPATVKGVVFEKGNLPGRDLSSILDSKVKGMPCPPRKILQLSKPQVLELRPNVFYHGSLYPLDRTGPQIVTPCVFSLTSWVRRKLNGKEMCRLKDLPELMIDSLSSRQIAELCRDSCMVPIKVITKLLDMIDNSEPEQPDKKVAFGQEIGVRRKTVDEEEKGIGPEKDDRRNQIVAKDDDAQVPEHLWNTMICSEADKRIEQALSSLWTLTLRWWKRKVRREFMSWFWKENPKLWVKLRVCQFSYESWSEILLSYLRTNQEAKKNWEAGRDCVARCSESSWWEWTDGSRPHFWRWKKEYRLEIRDGVAPWFRKSVPRWQIPQRLEKDAKLKQDMRKKLEKIRRLRYIIPGTVKSLTSFFAVPKGESDIRMVYDGTKSGLNDAMWAPWFALPTVEALLRFVAPGTYMGDLDIGDMFHNFIMLMSLRMVAGVDLTSFFPEELLRRVDLRVIWEHWCRCGMGFKNSPYNTIQGMLIAEEVTRGNPHDLKNIFRWSKVVINLPGDVLYKPWLPWVFKVRVEDGKLLAIF